MSLVAEIGISGATWGYDRLYSYLVPESFAQAAAPGERAAVPFGKGGKKRIGIILSVRECGETDNSGLKEISVLIDTSPVINGEMLSLLFWLRDMTLCTYYEAFKVLIPPGMNIDLSERYVLNPLSAALKRELSESALGLYACFSGIKNRGEREMMISAAFGGTEKEYMLELSEKGAVSLVSEAKQRTAVRTVSMVRLSPDYLKEPSAFRLSEKQKLAAGILEESGSAAVREICYLCGVTPAVVKNLVKSGAAEFFEYEADEENVQSDAGGADDIVLSGSQQEVFEGLAALADKGEPAAALLYGVTGSGKTAVFAKLIGHVLEKGRNVIVLIPEISLTPQTSARFTGLFGSMVSVIHSSLSMTRRLREYNKIRSGKSRIVVGTRSAVFSPLENIGLIIMDEEGEPTYKSEQSPRYNARDAAKKRCAFHNALLLMASATPSIESFYNAECGRYHLFRLTERYSSRPLPEVSIVDMGTEELCGIYGTFSLRLADEIQENLRRGEQTVLLLNRRGYFTMISCPSCREPLKCPNCSIPLTYHKTNGRLICHYCGYSSPMPEKCPSCGCVKLKHSGMGTQKLEDEIAELFPGARLLRMDADTAFSRCAYDRAFREFGEGNYDIMLGTQMIAKGLDFPNVTLVGVISVDKALFCGDFRSYERTFSLITQVVGRGGRGEKAGRAVIQTYVPDHYVIDLAARQNYDEFYAEESAMRKALIYPPYCDICVVGFSSPKDAAAAAAAAVFLRMIKERISGGGINFPMRVLGPSRCVFEKINGKYRHRMIIKCRNTADFREFIGGLRRETFRMKEFAEVQTYIDINGEIGL